MAGKGSEVGRTFEELRKIYDRVERKDRLRVCFDTCHVNDAGYDLVNDYEGVLAQFDKILGLDQIAVIHVNDSLNPLGAHKDRHANIGQGTIGYETLHRIVHDERFAGVPKILKPLGSAPRRNEEDDSSLQAGDRMAVAIKRERKDKEWQN